MALTTELDAVAAAAAVHSEPGETLAAVLPTEPSPGVRVYLCAFARGVQRAWLALDGERRVVVERNLVREAVSIAVLCEIAVETVGGGDLERLRGELVGLRLRENPSGIEEAEEAALAVERAVGAPPRVASPAYLDELGAAARRLERALGEEEAGSPFVAAMRGATAVVDRLTAEVERTYKHALR
ncbi:MAG: hypothetical protein ICV64_10335 [Thermoleophilia bacterium]|nr:hypothetical protein [Thermoleophilia bacterium]